jgi:hypothetical protein
MFTAFRLYFRRSYRRAKTEMAEIRTSAPRLPRDTRLALDARVVPREGGMIVRVAATREA